MEPKNLKDPKKWEEAVASNTDDYGICAINAARHTMLELEAGKTPEEAEKIGFHGKNLTGFLAGCTAQMIAGVHERGKEFNDWWNQKWGAPAGEAGTVNPAIWSKKA